MRTANYRDDVLWAIARKDGLDPETALLADQADTYASFINSWVRRLWDTVDFPEWTEIESRKPDANHIVDLDVAFSNTLEPPKPIGRVLKVYPIDPRPNSFAPYLSFRLTSAGLYVGTEHGAVVWIKFMQRAPEYTAKPWDGGTTYRMGQVVYSPITGECYQSVIGNNLGHDPAEVVGPVPLTVETTQKFFPSSKPTTATSEKWAVTIDLSAVNPAGANIVTYIELLDKDGGKHTFSATTPANTTVDALLDALIAAATGSSDPWITALTVTKDTPAAQLLFELGSASFSVSKAQITQAVPAGSTPKTILLVKERLQQYTIAQAPTSGTAQSTQVNLNPGEQNPGAAWSIQITDPDGSTHVATYQSLPEDGPTEIINGLLAALNPTPPNECFSDLVVTPDYDSYFLTIVSPEYLLLSAIVMPPTPATKWKWVPFPFMLVEQVVNGAYSDSLREQGQTDKAGVETQVTEKLQTTKAQDVVAPPVDPLTSQPPPASRYRIGAS
jgi:hypothetical protein